MPHRFNLPHKVKWKKTKQKKKTSVVQWTECHSSWRLLSKQIFSLFGRPWAAVETLDHTANKISIRFRRRCFLVLVELLRLITCHFAYWLGVDSTLSVSRNRNTPRSLYEKSKWMKALWAKGSQYGDRHKKQGNTHTRPKWRLQNWNSLHTLHDALAMWQSNG